MTRADTTGQTRSTHEGCDMTGARAVLLGFLLSAAHVAQAAEPKVAEVPSPNRKLDVWYVPTTMEIVERMLDVANVGPLDVVYDLGCGDGRIVIAAAKKYGARGVGVDLDPARIREARANAKKAGVEQLVRFEVGDMFKTDLTAATVVTLYLLPELNRRLKPKLFAELRPGARVVSHDWDMGRDWPPERYVKLGGDGIYLWTMPPWEDRPIVKRKE
jgi:SAM-dependent methyltransferase